MFGISKNKDAEHQPRSVCWTCRQPSAACYCHRIRTVDVGVDFVILIHPLEARRRIATGRMAHLILKDSVLIEGEDFSKSTRVANLINDPARECLILYPGRAALDLDVSDVRSNLQQTLRSRKKRLTIFVIDGTWATARKMMRLSENLRRLPMVKFQPKSESQFQVRKQPEKHCLSTIEAIHATIERLASSEMQERREFDHLIELFLEMVERQKMFVPRFRDPIPEAPRV